MVLDRSWRSKCSLPRSLSSVPSQHVEHGGEHRCGHGEDGLLGAAACLDAKELGAQVAGLYAHGCPRGGCKAHA